MNSLSLRPSTRQDILDILKRRGGQTVEQLSSILGITPMGVRQHLAVLEKDNLVNASVMRRGMGRPSYLYALTDQAQDLFPKAYKTFATGLLHDIVSHEGPELANELFRRRAKRLEKTYRQRLEGKDLEERVAGLAEMLDANGSMASYDKVDDDTFILNEHNCAIYAVAKDYPQVCSEELALFSRVLDADVTRRECQAEGNGRCQYLVRRRPR